MNVYCRQCDERVSYLFTTSQDVNAGSFWDIVPLKLRMFPLTQRAEYRIGALGLPSFVCLRGYPFISGARRAHPARPTQWREGQSATRSGLVDKSVSEFEKTICISGVCQLIQAC